MHEKLKNLFATVLKIDPASITDNSSPQTIATWDSLNHLNLIAGAEELFVIDIDPQEIPMMMENFGRFESVVANKQA